MASNSMNVICGIERAAQRLFRPFRATGLNRVAIPRALPWADMFCPCGACGSYHVLPLRAHNHRRVTAPRDESTPSGRTIKRRLIGIAECFARSGQFFALKGRHNPAQGNALGTQSTQRLSPERASQRLFRPFRATDLDRVAIPRALPWAEMFCPFGANDYRRLRGVRSNAASSVR